MRKVKISAAILGFLETLASLEQISVNYNDYEKSFLETHGLFIDARLFTNDFNPSIYSTIISEKQFSLFPVKANHSGLLGENITQIYCKMFFPYY